MVKATVPNSYSTIYGNVRHSLSVMTDRKYVFHGQNMVQTEATTEHTYCNSTVTIQGRTQFKLSVNCHKYTVSILYTYCSVGSVEMYNL